MNSPHNPSGALLGAADIMDALRERDPFALEDGFHDLVARALSEHRYVLLDDVHLLAGVLTGQCGMYPRPMFLMVALSALVSDAAERGHHLIIGFEPHAVLGAYTRVALGDFGAADFAAICTAHLGRESAAGIDFVRVHRFAPRLTARQLRNACEALGGAGPLDTDRFLEHLRATELVSNVDLREVQEVQLHDLKGMDDVLRDLEANVLLPLEHPELAAELGLKPKRGILLAGPPGTGKTTIGRALAHRIRLKFFLIDGTVIAGTHAFYHKIASIFEAAAQNAPAIIFLDDSDVIFESGSEMGLYRYLLTKLDGLESQSAGRVCVVLTAMDVGGIPPALVRSGRIELWLETRLPDENARAAILDDLRAGLAPAFADLDSAPLATATDGLSGADLRRVIEDGKILFAYDRARGLGPRPLMEYFLEAVGKVRENKEKYAAAEARARAARPERPPYFDALGVSGGLAGWTGFLGEEPIG